MWATKVVVELRVFCGNNQVCIGLDFGSFCSRTDTAASDPAGPLGAQALFSDTVGYTINGAVGANDQGTTVIGTTACTLGAGSITHVVREEKTPNPNAAANTIGQISILANAWPIIQLYDLNPTGNVIIQYNKGGNPQTTTLIIANNGFGLDFGSFCSRTDIAATDPLGSSSVGSMFIA